MSAELSQIVFNIGALVCIALGIVALTAVGKGVIFLLRGMLWGKWHE